MKRQAATCKGLKKRLRDLGFDHVQDPRMAGKVGIRLPTLLCALVTAMVTKARSLRMVEQRTAQLSGKLHSWCGVGNRIADNTFGGILPRLKISDLVSCLHRLAKAEHRRGNLTPTRLPVGTIAIDGKNLATLHWPALCRVFQLDPTSTTPAHVKTALSRQYPEAQLCVPREGQPYALLRAHTVTLVSAAAAPCLHLRPIEGKTNELGAMPKLLRELKNAFGHTGLFRLVTTDAGNTAQGLMAQIIKHGWDYFAQIKGEHGALYDETVRVLGRRSSTRAHATSTDLQNGLVVTYSLWRYSLGESGWLDWQHARQVFRIKRVACDPRTGAETVGNRYYVTNRPCDMLGPGTALCTSRAHWRCEDELHWTLNTELAENRRRLAWSQHPHGLLVVSVLRVIALAILAVARRLSRIGRGCETPTWHQVAEHFLLELCGSTLRSTAFDTV